MSDRSYLTVNVWACPEGERERARAVLVDWNGLGDDDDDGKLDLVNPYTAEEIPLGSGHDIAAELVDAAPGISFVLWQEPNYGTPGDLRAYTPELGMFIADCEEGGEVTLTHEKAEKAIEDETAAAVAANRPPDFKAALWRAYGGPWDDDWKAHQ